MTERDPDDAQQMIGAEGTEPAGEPRRTGAAKQRDLEECLDAALACTFPASDPVGCLKADEDCPPVASS